MLTNLKTQEYNPEWLLPPESEIAKWFSAMTDLYPRYPQIQIQICHYKYKLDNVNCADSFFFSAISANIWHFNPGQNTFVFMVKAFREADMLYTIYSIHISLGMTR